jgi:dipeptidase E
MLHLHDGVMELIGQRPMRIFKKGVEPFEVNAGDDLSFLM